MNDIFIFFLVCEFNLDGGDFREIGLVGESGRRCDVVCCLVVCRGVVWCGVE